MPQLLGDRLLPESVVSRRSQFRDRVRELRRPVRRFRENTVPGPDIIGSAEQRLTDVRNRLVSRQSVLDRIQARRGGGGGGGNGGGSNNSGSGSQPDTSQMT